jgi:hypothetical protein
MMATMMQLLSTHLALNQISLRSNVRYLDEFFHFDTANHSQFEYSHQEVHNEGIFLVSKIIVIIFRDMQKYLS